MKPLDLKEAKALLNRLHSRQQIFRIGLLVDKLRALNFLPTALVNFCRESAIEAAGDDRVSRPGLAAACADRVDLVVSPDFCTSRLEAARWDTGSAINCIAWSV